MRGSHYDPATRVLYIAPNASVYEGYHEKAHKVQHTIQCWPWRAWSALNGIRVLQYFARLLVEFDAMRRARFAMEWHGQWSATASNEASTFLWSYITGKENQL